MYRVPHYEVRDVAILHEMMEKRPLATVTSVFQEKPFVNHLPITMEGTSDGKLRLFGHMSRHNPQQEHIQDGSDLNIAFVGPHAYFNPSWYVERDVPTWNYDAGRRHRQIQAESGPVEGKSGTRH